MADRFRIGIVGCGNIAMAHSRAYQATDRADVVAVYDNNSAAAEAFAGECGAVVTKTAVQLAKEYRLDAVSICTPPAAHLENAGSFLSAGIPILCEKPLELNAEKALLLADAVREAGSLFMVAFCHRFHPPVIELKRLLDGGVLGRPLLFRNIFGGYLDLTGNHRTDPRVSGGGCLIDHCSHSVDLFRYLVGDPTHVQAMSGNIMQDLEIEDFGMMHLSIDDKSFGEITAGYSLPCSGNVVECYGTKGRAVVSYFDPNRPALTYQTDDKTECREDDCSSHPDRFRGEIEHFLDCLQGRTAPSVTVEDGLKVNQIVAAVYESIARGEKKAVKY